MTKRKEKNFRETFSAKTILNLSYKRVNLLYITDFTDLE